LIPINSAVITPQNSLAFPLKIIELTTFDGPREDTHDDKNKQN
jgi:hypothetical protein